MKTINTLQRGARVRITEENGTEKFGTLVQIRSKMGRYDVELDGVDYTKTNFRFHIFNTSQVEAI